MNVDGVITSIANQLVEVLQIPAQMAWQAGIEYTRIKGVIGIVPSVFFCVLSVFLTWHIWMKVIKSSEKYGTDTGDRVFFSIFGFIASIASFLISSIAALGLQMVAYDILQIIYPETMLIYKIIEKVLN